MGKPSPQAPAPIDPVALAGAQGAANVDTAVAQQGLNLIDSVGSPYGNVVYNQTGSVTTPGGDLVPRFTQNTYLSPSQNQLYDAKTGAEISAAQTAKSAIDKAGSALSKPLSFGSAPIHYLKSTDQPSFSTGYQKTDPNFGIASAGNIQGNVDFSNLPDLPGANDFSAERDSVKAALLSRFNEDIQNQENQTTSFLNASGLQSGSERYGDEMMRLDRRRNDAQAQAELAAGQEQSRLFGLASQARGQLGNEALAGGTFANQAQGQQFGQNAAQQQAFNQAAGQQFGQNQAYNQDYNNIQQQQLQNYIAQIASTNQARQQGNAETLQLRTQPINEAAALLGLGPGVQIPQAAPNFGVGVAPTDVIGANALQQQGAWNNYNQQMQQQNAIYGAIGGLGGALGQAAIMSDWRVKNIHSRIGETPSGIPIYLFSYKFGGPVQMGVIAQEAAKIVPKAVHDIGGVLHVNYGELV